MNTVLIFEGYERITLRWHIGVGSGYKIKSVSAVYITALSAGREWGLALGLKLVFLTVVIWGKWEPFRPDTRLGGCIPAEWKPPLPWPWKHQEILRGAPVGLVVKKGFSTLGGGRGEQGTKKSKLVPTRLWKSFGARGRLSQAGTGSYTLY